MTKSLFLCLACMAALMACSTNPGSTSSMGSSGAYSNADRGASGVSTSGDPLTSDSTGNASPLDTGKEAARK